MSRKNLLLLTVSLALASASSQVEPNFKVEPSHFLDFPITKKDFTNWSTMGSAIILKHKVVLAPESRDKKGIIYSTDPNPLMNDWMVDLELNLGNDKKTTRGGTGLGIFYLKSVDKVSHKESIFGYSNRFEGLGIYMNSILRTEENKEIVNAIQGFYNNGERSINVFSEKNHICFKKFRNLPEEQYVKLRIQYDRPLVTVQFYNIFTQQFEFCFSMEADLSYNGYFLLSGSSGVQYPDHVYLKSVKLYDPKTVATNEHFQEARHTKANNELNNKMKQGVKDIFEHQAQQDTHIKDRSNYTQLFHLIPHHHSHINHKLSSVIADQNAMEDRYFSLMRAVPNKQKTMGLLENVFNIKIVLNKLSQDIETQNYQLVQFEKELKKVRYQNDIQQGLQKKEVYNTQTSKLQADLHEVEAKLNQAKTTFQEYANTLNRLADKILSEADFTDRLERQRRDLAEEYSQLVSYDMSSIDQIFDAMDAGIGSSQRSWSSIIINFGMVMVTLASIGIWIKLNGYEHKNA